MCTHERKYFMIFVGTEKKKDSVSTTFQSCGVDAFSCHENPALVQTPSCPAAC